MLQRARDRLSIPPDFSEEETEEHEPQAARSRGTGPIDTQILKVQELWEQAVRDREERQSLTRSLVSERNLRMQTQFELMQMQEKMSALESSAVERHQEEAYEQRFKELESLIYSLKKSAS